MRIGIDFDNTIAGYDQVFPVVARKMELLPKDFEGGKNAVRCALRGQVNGEHKWQRLQGAVYGRFMSNAELIDGVELFLHKAKSLGADIFIISHKSQYSHFDPSQINLREVAIKWMEDHGFFLENGIGISQKAIHFLSSRTKKVERIASLKVDVFIDDLSEVFSEPSFSVNVRKILFTNGMVVSDGNYESIPDWQGIKNAVFPDQG